MGGLDSHQRQARPSLAQASRWLWQENTAATKGFGTGGMATGGRVAANYNAVDGGSLVPAAGGGAGSGAMASHSSAGATAHSLVVPHPETIKFVESTFKWLDKNGDGKITLEVR